MRRLLRFAALWLCVLCLLASAASARDWRIANFDTTIEVQQDGSAFVSEQITFVFEGSFQGVRRYIPIEYPGPAGSNYTLFLRVTAVNDYDNSRPLKYELSKRNGNREIKIYVPNANDTTRKIEINYLVENATRFFPDHQEFYWNVTGVEWPVPIDRATALIVFPDKAAGSLRAVAFTGSYGSTAQDATARITGNKVYFETTNPLPMRSGLTADVYLPLDTLTPPPFWEKIWWFAASNPISFLPLISFIVMFTLWYAIGRDPDPGMSVAPVYEPPANLRPAEVGTLVDDSIDPRDVTSTLIDLAVRGFIKIEEVPPHGLFSHRDYIFHRLKGIDEWASLRTFERVILEKFFGVAGTEVRLSSMNQNFYQAMPMINDDILNGLKEKGMYTVDPESAHLYWMGGILVIIALVVGLQYTGLVNFFLSGIAGIISIAVSIVIVYLYGRVMTAKSLVGARTYIGILGFQEFMTRVDADRINRMPADTFEKFLPYAMALGVENRWAKAFSGLTNKPPDWYQPAGGPAMMTNWNTLMFANNLRMMTNDAHQTFVSAPRNDSNRGGFLGGGGFSGGGFSGGGFGGGGGGAF